MASLIILGNPNQHTFANAITAANARSQKMFEGRGIEQIFVIHTPESEEKLASERDWLRHLKTQGVNTTEISSKIIQESTPENTLRSFGRFVEFIINGMKQHSDEVIVDLTNGTTFYKNLLAIVCYLLNIKHQFLIDIPQLSKRTGERGFLGADILEEAYIAAPDSGTLDQIAYLDLARVVRYKSEVAGYAKKFEEKFGTKADVQFFYDNLVHSIEIKFKAEQKNHDNSLYRIATGSMAASIEEMIHQIHLKHLGTPASNATLGNKIYAVQDKVKNLSTPGFDKDFLVIFNRMILYLRNNTIHKTNDLSDLERFKAEMMTQMAFPFIDYYLSFIDQILSSGSTTTLKNINILGANSTSATREKWFVGLDGDNTGQMLEELFARSEDPKMFKALSDAVKSGLTKVESYIKTFKPEIIFNAGDDLLFQAEMTQEDIRKLKDLYALSNPDMPLTCCVAYGKTIYDTYIAMSMAKATPGKNTVIGVSVQ